MATAESVKAKIRGLIDSTNEATGRTDTNLTDAVNHMIEAAGQGAAINGVVKQYKTTAGQVRAGDFVEFIRNWGRGTITGRVTDVAATALTDTRVLIAYRDPANNMGVAVVIDVDAAEITVRHTYTFSSSTVSDISCTALNDTDVLIAYVRDENEDIEAKALVVTDQAIFEGNKATLNSGLGYDTSVARLSDTRAVVVYSRTSDCGGIAHILTIEKDAYGVPTVVSLSAATKFDSNVELSKVVTLNAEKVLVAYSTRDPGLQASIYAHAMVLRINESTITRGNAYMTNSSGIRYLDATALTDDLAIIVYQDLGSSEYSAVARLLSISGQSVSDSRTKTLNGGTSSSNHAIVALNARQALVLANLSGSPFIADAILLTVSGLTITETAVHPVITRSGAQPLQMPNLIPVSGGALFVGNILTDSDTVSSLGYWGIEVDTENNTIKEARSDRPGGTYVQTATTNKSSVGVAKTAGRDYATIEVYCVE